MLDGPKPSPWIKNRNFSVYPHTFHLPHRKHPLSTYIKPTARNFGRIFDSDLGFQPHINKPVQAGSLELRTISKIKPMLPQSHIEKVIHSIIFSSLDCCDLLLSGDISNKSVSGFQLLQNAAARLLTGFKRQDHITPILASTPWLPVRFRNIFKILLVTFKAHRSLAPKCISNMLTPNEQVRSLRSLGESFHALLVSRLKMRGDHVFSATRGDKACRFSEMF